ncbi:copper oxidase [Beijerinckiaceae bacterium]|nr:copper oxidase [Beijerinckiaceae bacterium]
MPPSCATLSRRLFLGQTIASVLTLPARADSSPHAADNFHILEARPGSLRLVPVPGVATDVWGYNGEVPGPLLRFKKGEEVKVRLINKLEQDTTLTWHGVRIINAMDGVAGLTQKPVPPGESFDYRFIPPDSGLYWYHPHLLSSIREQIDRGLYGVMIVDEPEPPPADRNMLVVIADWKLDEKNQITGGRDTQADRGGERNAARVTVNSRIAPIAETLPPCSRLRLRILSAVDTRLIQIRFTGVKPLILALDGQPCEAFEPAGQTLPLGPGARFDVMLDLPAEAGQEAHVMLLGEDEPDSVLLSFKTMGEKRAPLSPIVSLAPNPLLPTQIKLQAARRITITMEAVLGAAPAMANASDRSLNWKLNGVARDGFAPAPLFSVKRGTPVTLAFINQTAVVQQMHVHGHVMRLLHDLDDGWEPYWRDAVLVPEGKTKHVAFVADNPGKWAIDCLLAGRLAHGMATWFEVT